MEEMERRLAILRRGVRHFFTSQVLALLSSWELELLDSGSPKIDLEQLKENTTFGRNAEECSRLWRALRTFSDDDIVLFHFHQDEAVGGLPEGDEMQFLSEGPVQGLGGG
jgi:hypothetical protein